MENVEIEYKMLLKEDEYQNVLQFILERNRFEKINQTNYYFDTKDFKLSKKKHALRIRDTFDGKYEICLKIKRDRDVLENNYMVDESVFHKILEDPNIINEYTNTEYDLILVGKLDNLRYEYKMGLNLVCLDHSKYLDVEDYEIEFEAYDYDQEDIFRAFLYKFGIEYHKNEVSKIQRCFKEYLKIENNL